MTFNNKNELEMAVHTGDIEENNTFDTNENPEINATCDDNEEPKEEESRKYDEGIKVVVEDNKKASLALTSSTIILWLLIVGGLSYYTYKWLNTKTNKIINTQIETLKKITAPVIVMKDYYCHSSYCFYPYSITYFNYSHDIEGDNCTWLDVPPTKDDLADQGSNTLCFRYYGGGLYQIAIIPPKDTYLDVGDTEYLGLKLYFYSNTIIDWTEFRDNSRDYQTRIWIYERNEYINYHTEDGGENAGVFVTPGSVYETSMNLRKSTRIRGFPYFGRVKRTEYSISLDGISTQYNNSVLHYDGSTFAFVTIFFNPPVDGRVTKDITSKAMDFFDLLSSVGGLYSTFSGVLGFIFGLFIWGKCGYCPYAKPNNSTLEKQIKNVILSTTFVLKTKEQDKPIKYQLLFNDDSSKPSQNIQKYVKMISGVCKNDPQD